MNINFKGQVALITGATRGIGKQIAVDMERLGANLILTGTNEEHIHELNKKKSKGRKINYYAVDFTNERNTNDFLDIISGFSKIDICINNAGINRINYIDETSRKDLNDIIAVNLKAPFLITSMVSKIMKRNSFGRIVNIASIWGVIGKAKRAAYSVSKFGIRGLTVTSAIEMAPYNVLVNSVSPGFVLTELTTSILTKMEIKNLAAQVPTKRFAQPDEISKVVLFLSSKENTYLTGQNIIVDGGFVNV